MQAHGGAVGEVKGLDHTGGFCGVSADVSNFDTSGDSGLAEMGALWRCRQAFAGKLGMGVYSQITKAL